MNTENNYIKLSIFYILIIIYGSLIPLDFKFLPIDQAINNFNNISWLKLSIHSRADWIANILLYIPSSFLLSSSLQSKFDTNFFLRGIKIIIIFFIMMTIAVAIEFFQQFFPPRTVSLNDIFAEGIGILMGILVWLLFEEKINFAFRGVRLKKIDVDSFLFLYFFAYIGYALFPFDIVTSFTELEESLSFKKFSWIGQGSKGLIFETTWLGLQLLLSVPIGLYLNILCKKRHLRSGVALFFGALINFLIEIAQIFMVSGMFSLSSLFFRISGFFVGVNLSQVMIDYKKLIYSARGYFLLLLIPYFVFLAYFNGWANYPSKYGYQTLYENFKLINWLPFYYHYYQPETAAVTSFFFVGIMYFPIGFVVGVYNNTNRSRAAVAVLLAMFISIGIELGKLIFSTKHPDPTNILIGMVFSWIGLTFARFIFLNEAVFANEAACQLKPNSPESVINGVSEENFCLTEESSLDDKSFIARENSVKKEFNDYGENIVKNSNSHHSKTKDLQRLSIVQKIIAFSLLCFVFVLGFQYPFHSYFLVAGFSVYIILLYKFRFFWLLLIPAILPVFDMAAYSGRFFFNELDFIIILTISFVLLTQSWSSFSIKKLHFDPVLCSVFILLFLSYFISLVLGLYPFVIPDENSFNNYYSHYNSLRVFKGVLLAYLIFILAANIYSPDSIKKWFSFGMIGGLVSVIIVSVCERIIFSGLFNYDSDYRITSGFSSMHTGGGHIDEYLMLAIPSVIMLVMSEGFSVIRFLVALLIFLSSLFVVMVTFSRGPYIGVLFEVAAFLFILLFQIFTKRHSKKKLIFVPIVISMAWLIVAPVFSGDYINQRFSKFYEDFSIRKSHWTDAISMMDSDLFTKIFGMGLGSYPRTYYWRNSENTIPATYRFIKNQEGTILQLSPGDSLYFEQIVPLDLSSEYLLVFEARAADIKSSLTIPICEKAMLYSFRCVWNSFQLSDEKVGEWQRFEKIFYTKDFSIKDSLISNLFRRPIKVSLFNGGGKAPVDVKSVQILDSNSNNIVRNPSFSQGMDNWYFSTDNHLPWHIKNIWVQVFFEQGWFGVVIFTAFILYSLVRFGCTMFHDVFSLIGFIALVGFLIVGFVDSPWDEPRLSFLFYLFTFFMLPKSDFSKRSPAV